MRLRGEETSGPGTLLSYPLETTFAFYNVDLKLFTVLARQEWWPERAGLPYRPPAVRKIENMRRNRDADLWERVETDPEYNALVKSTWKAVLANLPPPPPPEEARKAFEALLAQVAQVAQEPTQWGSTSRTTRTSRCRLRSGPTSRPASRTSSPAPW